jgi:branched-subunit amino acid transport protein
MKYVLLILGMAVITYGIRSAVFVFGERLSFPPVVRMALNFVPVTVLTAIIVPMTFAPHGGAAELTWRNSQLVAAVVAVGVSALTRKPLLTIAVSLAVFFFWQMMV